MLLGIALVALGVTGLILPVMPGWIFLIPGLVILADYFPPIRRLVDALKARFQEAEAAFLNRKKGGHEGSEPPNADLGADTGSAESASTTDSGQVP
ncbi:MAG: hypothetical protein IT169_12265 [Bryobacterales bacterium]|nr:hypothetical protein [Bryobacterales bacterium]